VRALLGIAALCALTAAAPDTPTSAVPMSAQIILGRVRAAFHAQPRPPYVVYTLIRHDKLNGAPDFYNSYNLRIWCRTSDRAALSRRLIDNRPGDMEFIRPEFDKPIDPGPPTADIFEALAPHHLAATPAPDASAAPVIGSVAVLIEFDYFAEYAGIDGHDYHLKLTPKRDPERNRLSDVYVDRDTYTLTRAVAHDHLYVEGAAIPERFEVDFGTLGDVPVITEIHGRTDYAAMTHDLGSAFHEIDYRFTNVRFPTTLPDWYFDPKTYGAHRAEAPQT
jgi:hypothetical protein